jgi:hypothetical protein
MHSFTPDFDVLQLLLISYLIQVQVVVMQYIASGSSIAVLYLSPLPFKLLPELS